MRLHTVMPALHALIPYAPAASRHPASGVRRWSWVSAPSSSGASMRRRSAPSTYAWARARCCRHRLWRRPSARPRCGTGGSSSIHVSSWPAILAPPACLVGRKNFCQTALARRSLAGLLWSTPEQTRQFAPVALRTTPWARPWCPHAFCAPAAFWAPCLARHWCKSTLSRLAGSR